MEMKKYKLSEICELNNATLKSSDNFDEILYLDTSNITKNCIAELQPFFIENAPSRAQRKVKDKTIIFSTVRPNQKHFGILNNPPKNLIVSTGFTTLDVKKTNDFDANYVYLKLTQPYIVNHLHTLAQNSVSSYPSINPDDIGNLRFDFPSLPTQQKIAAVLSSLDDKIALNKKINAKLEAMAKRLYDYWFVQFDYPDKNGKPYKTSGGKMVWNEVLKREIPEGWEVKSVFEASDVLYGYPYATEPFDEDNLELSKKPYKVVRIRDIQNNSFSAKTTEVVDEKYKTKQNDLLVGMDGYFHMNFWFSNNDYINQRIVRFRKTLISTLILNFQIKPFIKFKETMAKGSTVGHLSDKDLKQLFIAIPNDNSISDRFDSILNMITKNNSEIQKLTDLRDRLLPLLMNGQVEVK
ncbi:MAG: restriction endonuclease subunit S [Treponema sp.]|nr:restriction endonuclease subunit S [Treponema sp.]